MMGEVIRVSGRAPDVGEFLKEAMLSQRFADVALCCPGGQRFLAHRLVLSAASPYLQEVLLAHSRTSTHCEPITVILAEVEAPELAAILGFVYTGSATVPRPRLNAFLHAAEALHIRLPPVPVVMTCSQADCKQEDIKDVKINRKYLECDQYPCCDRWYRPRTDRDGDSTAKEEQLYPSIESLELAREIRPLPESMNFAAMRYGTARYCSTTWPVASFASAAQEKMLHRVDERFDKERMSQTDAPIYHPISALPGIDRIGDVANEHSRNILPTCDPSAKTRQQDSCCSRSAYDTRNGELDALEARMKADPLTLHRGEEISFRSEEDPLRKNATVYDTCSEQERLPGDRLSVIRSRIPTCRETTAATVQVAARSVRSDFGEDLTCHDNCFAWRSPRRQVANRVTASPWKQTIRPYHLPKLQPMVLQPHLDDAESRENRTPEGATRPPTISTSPNLRFSKNATPAEHYYTVQVPTTRQVSYNDANKLPEGNTTVISRPQEFYPPQIPPSTITQITPTINSDARTSETIVQPQNANVISTVTTRSAGNADANQTDANRNGCFGQTSLPQSPKKPEISHPVSRLCDTIEKADKTDRSANVKAEKSEKEATIEEKLVERVVINSDNNNNNDAIVSQEAVQRGRGGQENHRCDQCGKTFVTRASLKVHVRTHSGEKPFRCADCGKQFSQLRNYKYHRSVHEGTREFAATCPECGKYFNDRGYLSSHMKIHRNRKEYGCAECGKSFNQRVAYNMHVRIHTGVKPHQCEQCGKAFSRKMLLKQHLRTHSGERPYQCQVCQKAFADRSNMTLHTRLHSGLKPYQCTLCSKAFTKKHHLKTHLNYHTGTKPYSCPNCGLRFSQSSNMRTHFKKCTVNNPGEMQASQLEVAGMDASNAGQARITRTPTETLTPPNSDQELSILTPICKSSGADGHGT